MPKAKKPKFYAVRVGREGPNIYSTWDECKTNTERWPGAVHKSFNSKDEASQWLHVMPTPTLQPIVDPPHPIKGCPENVLPAQQTSESVASRDACKQFTSNEEVIPVGEKPADAQVVLSLDQKKVLQIVKGGRNVFFTGSAGTGKSVLLREIIRTMGGSMSSSLAITASTGIASVNIGGTTLHSWAGIGLGQELAKKIAGKIAGQQTLKVVRDRWRTVQTLIIDEISMIDGVLFDKLEYIARHLRQNDLPFGGIQLILSGDFFQLPPVPSHQTGVSISSTFAFEALSWDACVGQPVELTRVFRQKDQDFVDMLNAMRFGQLNQTAIAKFNKLSRPVTYGDGIEPTELFSTRREVENANNSRLNALSGTSHVYTAQDFPGYDSKNVQVSHDQMGRLLERLVVAKMITLKVGAQVMLIKNLVQGELVNGSVGQVISFSTAKEVVEDRATIAQVDDASRGNVSSNKPLIGTTQNNTRWPLVRFTSGIVRLIVPAEFTVNNAQGGMEARRDQIPLILAWALSVHKSQGQTLERVKVDLGRTFEKGQAYVALSRATSMKGLQVLQFDPSKVMAHSRVLAWYNGFEVDAVNDEDEMDNEEAIASFYNITN